MEKDLRIGVTKEGILIQIGDPSDESLDKEYMDIVRDGGMVKLVSFQEYMTNCRLYKPYPLQGVEEAAVEYAEGMMGIGRYDAKWHYNDKVMYNNLKNSYKSGAKYASQFKSQTNPVTPQP